MSPHTQGFFPPENILVPTDLGPSSEAALRAAGCFEKCCGAKLHVLHAHMVEMPPYFSSGQIETLLETLRTAREAAGAYVSAEVERILGHPTRAAIVEKPPLTAVLDAIDDLAIDLVVMGTHGRRGAERAWIGSVAEGVVRRSTCPVLTVREDAKLDALKRVLCAVDEGDQTTLAYAGALAERFGARLIALHVSAEGEAVTRCPCVSDDMTRGRPAREIVRQGERSQAILATVADEGVDLVVMGSRRKSSPFGELFSTTTERVLRLISIPLLVIPRAS